MKIKQIDLYQLQKPRPQTAVQPKRPSWVETAEVANPVSVYPHLKPHRNRWYPQDWGLVWCKVTLEDGTWGLGMTYYGWTTAGIIKHHLAPNLIGEDGLEIERINEMLWRMSHLYGAMGLAAYAISAIDLALWDAKGKLLQKSVAACALQPPLDRGLPHPR